MSIFKVIPFAYHWAKSLRLIDSCEHEKALIELQQAVDAKGSHTVRTSLMEAQIHYVMGNIDKLLHAKKRSEDLISNSSRLSDKESDYLKLYLDYLEGDLKGDGYIGDEDRLLDIDLSNISDKLRKLFPLRIHPKWDAN